jgi:parallel beta-helix repeat protein
LNACGELGRLCVGDGLSCIYTVSAGVQLVNSADLTMYGINVYVAKALGAEWYGAGNHLWKDCYFGPRPGTSQWQGGDGFMFCGTGRGPKLDHVTMLHTTDDMANFHGYWTEAIAAVGNQLTFTNHDGNSNLLPPGATIGNTVLFYDRNSGNQLGQGNVVALTSNTATLNVSATNLVSGIARWPDHECAGWVIQNCYWHDNYQRVLMQSGPGLIQNCTFARNGSCLELNSVFPYIEGGIPNGIVIANNAFTDVAPLPGQAPIGYHEDTYGGLTARLISNLTIAGNTITSPGEAGVELLGVNGGTIAGNTIVNPIRETALFRSGQTHLQQAIFLRNCANISVLTNAVSDLGHFTAPSPLTSSHILGIDASCQGITNLDGILLD